MWPFGKMSPESDWAMRQRISPCCATSPSISYARTRAPNSGFTTNGSKLAGMRRISLTSSLATPFSAIALCIQTAQGDADGTPTTVLEAMAFGLPVVSSHLLSLPYYVRNGQEGILTSPGDEEAIARALAALCDNRQQRITMGQAGRVR